MTERMRLRKQAAEMLFLRREASVSRREASVSRRDKVRSSVICEELGVELLLLCIERSQWRWLRQVVGMPLGCLPREAFQACPAGKRPRADPGPGGEIISLHWPENASGSPGRGWLMWSEKGKSGSPVETAASVTRPQICG